MPRGICLERVSPPALARLHEIRRIHIKERVRRVIRRHDLQRVPMLNLDAHQPLRDSQKLIFKHGVVFLLVVGVFIHAAARRRSERPVDAHIQPHKQPPRRLYLIVGRFERAVKFLAAPWRQIQPPRQFRRMVADDAEEIDDAAVNIVVRLQFRARFVEQHRRRASARLAIGAMRREMGNNPLRAQKLAA